MRTNMKHTCRTSPSEQRADRHTRAQAFCQCHHIGRDVFDLMCEPLSCAPNACLHLIDDEQPLIGIAQRANLAQNACGQTRYATLALHHFEHHRDHIQIRLQSMNRTHIVEWHAYKTCDQWVKTFLHLGIACRGERRQRAPMKRLAHHNDFAVGFALLMPIQTRQLNRALIRLRTAVGEKHLIHARKSRQLICEFDLLRHLVQITHMNQLTHLLAQSRDQARMVVPQSIDRNPRERVKILLAVGVREPNALPMRKRHGQTVKYRH